MDSEVDGITGLFSSLCERHIKDEPRAYIVQPKLAKDLKRKRLKKVLYDTLFNYLKGPHRLRTQSSGPTLSEVDKLHWAAFQLRCQRKYDEANHLDDCVQNLTKDGLSPLLREILHFLLCLADTGEPPEPQILGHGDVKMPIVFPSKDLTQVLPEGPLCYGDSRLYRRDDLWYTHYPRHVFEVQGIDDKHQGEAKYEMLDFKIFEATPGQGLPGHGIFNVTGCLNDSYEVKTRTTLFGALVGSETDTLDTHLDIPDIPNSCLKSGVELKVPKVHESPSFEDEGYVESASIASSSISLFPDVHTPEDDIWDLALKSKPNLHYVWERVGRAPKVTERPYITEAGPLAFDKLYQTRMRQLQLLDPSILLPQLKQILMKALVKDVINLLLGIPSKTFIFEQEDQEFHLRKELYISGLSPESLQKACVEVVACGSNYWRLTEFSMPVVMDSNYHGGLVYQAFIGAVRKYLQHYRGQILSLPPNKTVMELNVILARVMAQIRFLGELCKCSRPPPGSGCDKEEDHFPTGVNLLSYLYQETLDATSTQHYPMMLFLLHSSCGPYLMFLQDWVFQGICRDVYGEFMIQVNEDYLRFRDKHYWSHGYVMVSKDVKKSVPHFLRELASDVFNCGKSINLLKLCAPQHFLFNLDLEVPRIVITFSEEDLTMIEKRCQIYLGQCQQIATQRTISRKQFLERAAKAKQALMGQARIAATEELQRLQGKIDDIKKTQDAKKRKVFAELKEQMEKDLQRRADEQQQEKAEDAARVAATNRQELLEAQIEDDLEKQAREELIQHYAMLSEEASYREQKALWKIQRHKLDRARIDFLQKDEAQLLEELEKKAHSKEDSKDQIVTMDALDEAKSESVLPNQSSDKASEKEPVKSPADTLPKWAGEGLKRNIPAFGLENTIPKNLPSWAKKGLESTDDEVFVIGDETPSTPLTSGLDPVEGLAKDSTISVVDGATPDAPDVGTTKAPPGGASGKPVSLPLGPLMPKPHIRMSPTVHVNKESPSLGTEVKSSIKVNEGINSLQQSEPLPDKPSVRLVDLKHISQESDLEDTNQKTGIKVNKEMSVSKESTPSDEQYQHIRVFEDRYSTQESTQTQELVLAGVRTVVGRHVSLQSEQEIKVIRRSSLRSHVSHMSQSEPLPIAPKLKRNKDIDAFKESDWTSFQIKRHRKKIEGQDVGQLSSETDGRAPIPRIKRSDAMYATKESEYIDVDKVRLDRFKQTNVFGHSSDSTVQRLLYGDYFSKAGRPREEALEEEDLEPRSKNVVLWMDLELEPYRHDFAVLDNAPMANLMSNIMEDPYGGSSDYNIPATSDISAYKFISLPVLFKRSITTPLQAQITLVNQSLVTYFQTELFIEEHFAALRSFLFMEDGGFGQSLSDQLFEKLATNPLAHEMLNPMYLNNVLSRAMQSSLQLDSKYADNINFALKYIPTVLQHNAADALDCLELTYKADWPLNIIVTETCRTKYGKVFSFMLGLRRAVWVLKDIWHRLKRNAILNNASNSPQFRQLQLYRHEMQHFVKLIQGYITNQIIHVTWKEFQEDLGSSVHSMDDLHRCHANYLNKCIFRCLLNVKARPVMKFIKDIFCLILKFRTQLVSQEWSSDPDTGEVVHPAFENMCGSYEAFKEYSRFLFKLVNKLATRGYQPHLQELLLRLNFNHFYSSE